MARCHNIKKIADFSVINFTAVNHVGIAYLLVLNGRSGSIKLVSRRQEEGFRHSSKINVILYKSPL